MISGLGQGVLAGHTRAGQPNELCLFVPIVMIKDEEVDLPQRIDLG